MRRKFMGLTMPLLVTFFYFAISWGWPWPVLVGDFSSSYLFDLFFIFSIAYIYGPILDLDYRRFARFVPRLGAVITLAFVSIGIIGSVPIPCPFGYVDVSLLQLIFVAPIIEEFIFRYAFIAVYSEARIHLKMKAWINAAIFSMSHLPGIWVVPEEFQSFVIFQMFYTLLLGRICAMAKYKHHSIVGPILLHMAFNLLFAIALSLKII